MAKVYVCPQCGSKLFNPQHLEEKECKVCKTTVRPELEERKAPTPVRYDDYRQESHRQQSYAPFQESREDAYRRNLMFRVALVMMGLGVVLYGVIFYESYVLGDPDIKVFNSCILASGFFGYGLFVYLTTRKRFRQFQGR